MASSPLRSLFRRGDTAEAVAPAPAVADPAPPSGKGRPTPKRREAEQHRRRRAVQAPKSRKEAARLQRDQARERRQQTRRAYAGGDTRHLPPRDAGPVRAYVRDYVDARRNLTSYFIPAVIVVFGVSTSPVAALRMAGTAVLAAVVVVIAADSMRLSRGVLAGVAERFPAEPTRGLKSYAVMRSMQFRRMRLPKPRVKLGDPV